ncbi:MAG: transketolase [Desulfovibrionaceae bacterium]|nr:transketolase [Desulfovibrionaceae bacterium]
MPTRKQLADALRVLSIDAIDRAQSGHPGAPMGMADMAEVLFRHAFKHSPLHPTWANRDRFVLSNGHASMLLYAALHLMGYAVSLEDLQNFRQLGSPTPGHPEYGVTPGVDFTTGPLGQGVASAVGLALGERMLAHTFNRPDFELIQHYTYCFCGDGCLMEGVAAEACSLAATWQLGKLIVFYDANGISIDGKIDAWFSEDVGARFKAYGWQVLGPIDGHDPAALETALKEAQANTRQPSLLICQTHIGLGSPEVDSAACHGAPLKKESLSQTKASYNWSHAPFEIPEEIYAAWDAREKGSKDYEAWCRLAQSYQAKYPELYAEFERRLRGDFPDNLAQVFTSLETGLGRETKALATRKASKSVLDALTEVLPELVGGSADLTGSVGTMTNATKVFDPTTGAGNYLYYGVREFAMACIVNGLAVHGGFLPYAGTFLAFSDQAKNALRLGCLMRTKTIWVFTHDSIGVGEDGPTHQPVEQIAVLRALPHMTVWRPCDSKETIVAWESALKTQGPTALILSRQSLPAIEREDFAFAKLRRGGYIVQDCEGSPELILLATGSEVALAAAACAALSQEGHKVRLVSMPSTEVFQAQEPEYQEAVLPKSCRKRLALEAGIPDFWWKYVGLDGAVIGMEDFGISGKAQDVFKHFGFTVEHVLEVAHKLLA